MLLFVAWFSAYSIRLHNAQLTHKSDLGQMDQAIWNTAHGRFVQETRGDRLGTRMTDHVEPIFALVSPVFWLWDDVRALLALQTLALALGAWPIFLLARKKLADAGLAAAAEWGGAVFAATYLLTPQLQAGAVAEFHAMPLAAPLIAAALWAIEQRRWGWFIAWAVLLALVQEGMALLTATLGLYVAVKSWWTLNRQTAEGRVRRRGQSARYEPNTAGLLAGAGAFLIGLAWFAIATFIIIPHYAGQQYAISETPYAARYGELGNSFGSVLLALFTRPGAVLRLALEPLRVQYLLGLLIPTAGLALLGPELLLVSGPLLLANLLSSYPLQYSGELHYSTALAPFFVAAAAVGAARLLRDQNGQGWAVLMGRRLPTFVLSGVVGCALIFQVAEGFTPIGGEFRRSPSRGWPQVTAHERMLARFSAQIPPTAPLSTTAALYPHFTHREYIYRFPTIADAAYVLVDVTGATDMHPNDVKGTLDGLLASGAFAVADAADGYLLLERGGAAHHDTLPDSFFDFARATDTPHYPLDVAFAGKLKLVGYAMIDDPKWRLTKFRFYWQVTEPLPANANIRLQVLSPAGDVTDDSTLRPLPALLWYPPARWQPGETVMTESLAWYLPYAWAPVLTVALNGAATYPAFVPNTSDTDMAVAPDGALRLPAWRRQEGALIPLTGAPDTLEAADARFAAETWTAHLVEWAAPVAVAPGQTLPVALHWRAAGPATRDYSVFLHVRDATGHTVAKGDAGPTWFVPRPTSHWLATPADAPSVWDGHSIHIPPDVPAGQYTLVVGMYNWETGERLALETGLGNRQGDEAVLGAVTIDPLAAPRADACCLISPECCASLER